MDALTDTQQIILSIFKKKLFLSASHIKGAERINNYSYKAFLPSLIQSKKWKLIKK